MPQFEIPYYHDYISSELADYLIQNSTPFEEILHLRQVGPNTGLETPAALQFLVSLYTQLEADLKKILLQRQLDRKFIDERVKACHEFNENLGHDFSTQDYQTIIGLEDSNARVVVGPKNKNYCHPIDNKPIAPVPDFLKGPHVTLFGPPGTAKMAINAMNTYYRKLKDEPEIVEKLLLTNTSLPKWGADDEDSKTPLRADLVSSSVNLTQCFEKNIKYYEDDTKKEYLLASENLSIPIKRFPGLALPCTFLFYNNSPIPLHLYDFALHLFKNWSRPESLVFYVPKLENEEEAAYIHKMVFEAEKLIKSLHPEYQLGSIRLMIVLENPRAILRTHEIIDALYPYFVGASLGWHDYLASTARLFKEDSHYRIPVKADPDIVIKYIKASHNLLADVVGSRGGIKVGGMYGILPLDNNPRSESFQITIKGYIKDVITQMKRNLTGFWVAHPDFVRLGLALVEAWRLYALGNIQPLHELIEKLLDKKYHQEVIDFIQKPDIAGLDKNDPQYVRSLIVADIKESDFIANNHPDEIRYNVFQSLQYLTDWLSGNGCVALPAHVHGVAVRVMDDLATAERSRWEVWHEIYHGRFKVEDFLKIAFEELHFIRKDLSNKDKIVQVKWTAQTEKWYPIAFQLMVQLMTAKKPVEFATELLMPFTVESIRNADEPLLEIKKIDPNKYHLDLDISLFNYYFEICGCADFAKKMSHNLVLDLSLAKNLILNFTKEQILEAASFHGNIGESKSKLDSFASAEQALVHNHEQEVIHQLIELGETYLNKFKMKFLISAKNKTGVELLKALKSRLNNTEAEELENAKQALWEISYKRFLEKPINKLHDELIELQKKYQINNASLAISINEKIQTFELDTQGLNTGNTHVFQLASLSKSLATAFAIEYFKKKNIPLETSVSKILADYGSQLKLEPSAWAEQLVIKHLLNHSAINMHYVNGFNLKNSMPSATELVLNSEKYSYPPLKIVAEPGTEFHYSGGGFILLEYLIELIEKNTIYSITDNFFKELNISDISFDQKNKPYLNYANGYFADNTPVNNGRLMFPAFAAGGLGTANGVAHFLNILTNAYHNIEGFKSISHDTAVEMLHGTDKGCRDFMGCDMGLGIFVAECGDNKVILHQGANEGFRCLFVHCFSGPNRGTGFTLLCNADNNGVLFIAEAAQKILKQLSLNGVNTSKFDNKFDYNKIQQEQIVNLGYKQLIFSAFEPTLPEKIVRTSREFCPLAAYNLLTDAQILKVSNQKFARAENLISPYRPTFDPELFGNQGKIMDSWESARHNTYDYEWLILRINQPQKINYLSASTQFHDGNQAEFIRLLGYLENENFWQEILPQFPMMGHSEVFIKLPSSGTTYQKFKVEMYPDGGLTRLGLYNQIPQNEISKFVDLEVAISKRCENSIPKTHKPLSLKYEATPDRLIKNISQLKKLSKPINLLSLAFGAKLLYATNEHYGPAIQVISPYPAIHMFDGLESARSRKPHHYEEVIIQLAEISNISKVIIDFKFFINNNPREIVIDALTESNQWINLISKNNVKAFAGNKKLYHINSRLKFKQLKIITLPDGGINRIEAYA